MPATMRNESSRVIVIPRPLEGFFYERLTSRFSDRADVTVLVDRRLGERRSERWVSGSGPLSERRSNDRREDDVVWSLRDMPFAVPEALPSVTALRDESSLAFSLGYIILVEVVSLIATILERRWRIA